MDSFFGVSWFLSFLLLDLRFVLLRSPFPGSRFSFACSAASIAALVVFFGVLGGDLKLAEVQFTVKSADELSDFVALTSTSDGTIREVEDRLWEV